MNRILLALLILCCCIHYTPASGQSPQPSRTWKDLTGKYSIEAVFVRVAGDQVVLRRVDNKKEITLSLIKLSLADQQYVRKLIPPVPRQADGRLNNNLKCVDLSDLKGPLPLKATFSKQILKRTQDWERSSHNNPKWPSAGDRDVFGYPTVVKNVHGRNQDSKYYLYYAHHDPMSGIGCAVADKITGPYTKAAVRHEKFGGWTDSQVLVNPNYRPAGPNPAGVAHFSSPCVVWNEDEQLWFLYFHYFNHSHGAWTADSSVPGEGWQMTALATCPDLSSHNWTIWMDPARSRVSVWGIVPVLPTTDKEWMSGGSSYHAIQRLPTALPGHPGKEWLAFMRGTNVKTGKPTVGFGASSDGRNWNYFPENPVIAPGRRWTRGTNAFRPAFVGYLGKSGSGKHEYLVAWSEHPNPQVIYSKTTDFKTFQRDGRGYAQWQGPDGLTSPWREGDRLYLFGGTDLHVLDLPVSSRRSAVNRGKDR